MKQKTFDIEELLNNDNKTEDIMKEIEEEQKKWEEKINSSKSSFSINSSIKDDKKKNDYKINVYEFNNLDEKNKKHIIREKKLENKIENAQNILKYRDLVSNETRERLNKEKKEKKELEGSNYISSDGTDKSMSESSYLSYLSKIQGYPY